MTNTESSSDDLGSDKAQPSKISENRLIEEARELIIAGEHEKALPLVFRALNINENSPEALWLYARLIADSEKEKAIIVVKQLLALVPDHERGQALLKRLETEIVKKPSRVYPSPQPPATNQPIRQQQAMRDYPRQQRPSPVYQTGVQCPNCGAYDTKALPATMVEGLVDLGLVLLGFLFFYLPGLLLAANADKRYWRNFHKGKTTAECKICKYEFWIQEVSRTPIQPNAALISAGRKRIEEEEERRREEERRQRVKDELKRYKS